MCNQDWNSILNNSTVFILIIHKGNTFKGYTKGNYQKIVARLFKEKPNSPPSEQEGINKQINNKH